MRYTRDTPERSYVFGEDPNGGVFDQLYLSGK